MYVKQKLQESEKNTNKFIFLPEESYMSIDVQASPPPLLSHPRPELIQDNKKSDVRRTVMKQSGSTGSTVPFRRMWVHSSKAAFIKVSCVGGNKMFFMSALIEHRGAQQCHFPLCFYNSQNQFENDSTESHFETSRMQPIRTTS